MAYSMMSTTNHKRRCVSSSFRFEADINNEANDWIKLDLEDFINEEEDYYDDELEDNNNSCSIYSGASDFLLQQKPENLMSNNNKKRKAAFVDHDLEDTATSPLQTPKVNHLNLFYMKSKEMDSKDICQMQENGGNISWQAGDSTKMGSLESELRKKGLCLIPTSVLLNYLTA